MEAILGQKIGNGSLNLPLRGRLYFTVWGGPYRKIPANMVGVKMAAEIKDEGQAASIIDIPTQDYSVPDKKLLYKGLNQAVDQILAGKPVYVGCMGGMGRTGLFLAVLAKAFGIKNPVKFVRANYYPHAVETEEQKKFVKQFAIQPQVYIKLKAARKKAFWRNMMFWKPACLTTVDWFQVEVAENMVKSDKRLLGNE